MSLAVVADPLADLDLEKVAELATFMFDVEPYQEYPSTQLPITLTRSTEVPDALRLALVELGLPVEGTNQCSTPQSLDVELEGMIRARIPRHDDKIRLRRLFADNRNFQLASRAWRERGSAK